MNKNLSKDPSLCVYIIDVNILLYKKGCNIHMTEIEAKICMIYTCISEGGGGLGKMSCRYYIVSNIENRM